ncbi:MAG TPA: hypothetical protein VK897_18810 [Anaerolineales bacterium]|nr:hypothetical protein [Anaerolineales bacterium]
MMRITQAPADSNIPEYGYDLHCLIEQIWYELDEQVSRDRIREIAIRVANIFVNATVTTHIPLFVHHLTREWLKGEMKGHHAKISDPLQPCPVSAMLANMNERSS